MIKEKTINKVFLIFIYYLRNEVIHSYTNYEKMTLHDFVILDLEPIIHIKKTALATIDRQPIGK